MAGYAIQMNSYVRKSIFYFFIWFTEETDHSQPAFTCSKLTIETLEQVVKYVRSYQ